MGDEILNEDAAKEGIEFQHVIITFADGRRGVFTGPAVIKEIEMKLGTVPRLVSVDFDPPKMIQVPVKKETPDANSEALEQPASTTTGLDKTA